ncbi:hypothetical protein B0A50_04108 [Salinomyces thailandicus]|uniref:Cell cycle inhibitor Nif1 n=1 Tax=Salinomyces thailandicus TaxID=706561 RepID=A0A4U0U046_9PEZI|nr:hypothetical protein B0A50_04108 [Salinomyces thailandica]
MGPRPQHLNLHNDDRPETAQPPRFPFQMDLPSPRAGEVPPALSPLDAFALHSRILARQFEQEKNGRRISRLPHQIVSKELSNRPDYFRSPSGGSGSSMGTMSEVPEIQEELSPTSPRQMALAVSGDEANRPKSYYPMMGHASKLGEEEAATTPFYDAQEQQQEPPKAPSSYFGLGVPRAASPEPVDPKLNVEAPSPNVPSLTNSMDSLPSTHPRTMTNGSATSQRSFKSDRGGLHPTKSPGFPKSPRSVQSIRSVPPDSGDEDGSQYAGTFGPSTSRKFSGSSNMSRPHSPFSPYIAPVHRSPSITSEYSMNSSQGQHVLEKPRAPFNFSRPRSSGGQSIQSLGRPSFDGRPSLEARPSAELVHRQRNVSGASSTAPSSYHTNPSTRQNSADEDRPSANMFAANVHLDTPPASGRPENAPKERFPEHGPQAAPSYIYTKYSLPRGRVVGRDSNGVRDSWIHHQFTWEERNPAAGQNPNALEQVATAPQVFPSRPREDSDSSVFSAPVRPSSPAGSTGSGKISGTRLSRPEKPSYPGAARSRSANPDSRTPSGEATTTLHRPNASVQTESTDRTIRAIPSLHQRALSTELTPEEHLEIGIQTHSSGNLTKSTYHLRLAARAGLPTAMLLYALANRHGWGVRPNQEEGVSWLRRAIESSGLEIGDVEETVTSAAQRAAGTTPPNPQAVAQERKKRRAQFALAVYELGISYMNGWGCSKDKVLALRCYEVAGSWGDCDALAEAGFCHTQGVGCKKDLKKAAALYRKAADGGMSMAGNSWIYKAKYLEDPPSLEGLGKEGLGKGKRVQGVEVAEVGKEVRERERAAGRARGRSIWGRRKEKV